MEQVHRNCQMDEIRIDIPPNSTSLEDYFINYCRQRCIPFFSDQHKLVIDSHEFTDDHIKNFFRRVYICLSLHYLGTCS